MQERQIIEISSKHKVLRIVLFAAAFIIAILAVYTALTSFTKKTPGWQKATANVSNDIPIYSHGFQAYVYMEGSSSEIRTKLESFNKIYSDNLMRAYKFLDCENMHDGYKNIASINFNLGSKVKLAPELYEILQDAYSKSLSGEYGLFGGPLFRLQEILANTDDYDKEYEDKRISLMKDQLADMSNFTVEFLENNYVLIDVSEEYKSFLKEYEFNYPIIDLGENYFYYKTVLMDKALSDNGYPGCMFYAE